MSTTTTADAEAMAADWRRRGGDIAASEHADAWLAEQERVAGALADRGFDPALPLFEGGPTLGEIADVWRRIAVLEVGPVPGIKWLQRHTQRLDVDQQVQDDLWRAYERQSRDELDHGAYWEEMYFVLTGDGAEEKPWDAIGEGGSNVQIEVPPDVDDPEQVRSMVFFGSAFALGLESGFAEVSFPTLQKMLRASDLEIARTFLPLLRQIGRDEARHLAIHRYVFHHLVGTTPANTVDSFMLAANTGRAAFGVPAITEKGFAKHVGREAPPTTDQILGPDHLRVA